VKTLTEKIVPRIIAISQSGDVAGTKERVVLPAVLCDKQAIPSFTYFVVIPPEVAMACNPNDAVIVVCIGNAANHHP
jgi:hypothetical protein